MKSNWLLPLFILGCSPAPWKPGQLSTLEKRYAPQVIEAKKVRSIASAKEDGPRCRADLYSAKEVQKEINALIKQREQGVALCWR